MQPCDKPSDAAMPRSQTVPMTPSSTGQYYSKKMRGCKTLPNCIGYVGNAKRRKMKRRIVSPYGLHVRPIESSKKKD